MRILLLASAIASLLGCQQELGRPPVPRFSLDPLYVPAGDAFETQITLDSTESADELDDPTAALDVQWSFDDEVRFVEGTSESPRIVVTASGERPITIVLTVTDPDGLWSSLSQRLGVVLPEE